MFEGYWVYSQYKYSDCGYSLAAGTEPFTVVKVGLPSELTTDSLSLQLAFNREFDRHPLPGYRCDHCNAGSTTSRVAGFAAPPPNMIVQLKRFEGTSDSTPKRQDKVVFEDFLTVQQSEEHDGVSYDLVAVVNHHGASTHSGHYTASVLGGNGQWWKMDDGRKRELMASPPNGDGTAQDGDPYMFFYTKRDADINRSASAQNEMAAASKEAETVQLQREVRRLKGLLEDATARDKADALVPCTPPRRAGSDAGAVPGTPFKPWPRSPGFHTPAREYKMADGEKKCEPIVEPGVEGVGGSFGCEENGQEGGGGYATAPKIEEGVNGPPSPSPPPMELPASSVFSYKRWSYLGTRARTSVCPDSSAK